MPETEAETAAPAAPEVVKEEAVKAEADNKEEKKDEEKKEGEEKETKKKEKKVKEPTPPAPTVHKKDYTKDTVYVYQFGRTPVVPSVSPACLKVETWLKLNGIEYENIDHHCKLRSKRGLLPFVELNGEEICDSDAIIKQLATIFGKEDPAKNLSADQKNVQHAMVTMVENHLQWPVMHWRTKNIDNTVKGYQLDLQSMMGTKMPAPILNFAFKHTYLRKGARKVKAAGFAGYSVEEIEQFGKDDLKVLSELLGDKQFFFGDDPNRLDLVTFAQLALILNVNDDETTGVKCPLKDFINAECTNLVGLYTRMKDRAWGDHWEDAVGEKMKLNPHIPDPEPEPPKEEEKKEEEKGDKKEEEKEKGDKDEKEKEEKKEEEENKESK